LTRAAMVQVCTCYPEQTAGFAQEVMDLLDRHYAVLNSALRQSLVKSLILLRNRGHLKSAEVLPLFFRLFRCQDKGLRDLLFKHIVAGTCSSWEAQTAFSLAACTVDTARLLNLRPTFTDYTCLQLSVSACTSNMCSQQSTKLQHCRLHMQQQQQQQQQDLLLAQTPLCTAGHEKACLLRFHQANGKLLLQFITSSCAATAPH